MNICQNKVLKTPSVCLLFICLIFGLSNSCNAQTIPSAPAAQNVKGDCKTSEEKENILPEWKGTPLHLAIIERDVKKVKKLLKQKSDPNEKDNYGDTPLKRAVAMTIPEPKPRPPDVVRREMEKDRKSQIQLVLLLIEAGADVNLRGIYGITPLIEVTVFNYPAGHAIELLSLLIKNEADVNLQDDEGYTALMLAAKNGNPKVVKFLLENGAKTEMTNCADKTALSIAQENKREDVIRILQQAK